MVGWVFAHYALPSLAILLGIGFESVFARLRPPRLRVAASAVLMLLFGAGYLASTQHVMRALRSLPLQETKSAVALMRPVRDPFDPANDRIVTVAWMRTPWYYDPRVHKIRAGAEELRALLRDADATGRTLYVTYTRPPAARRSAGDLVAMAEDPTLFEPIAEFHGFEPRGHMRVFRYRGRGDAGTR
jgi:hypothetical protein